MPAPSTAKLVWRERRDTGGMFEDTLEIHHDPTREKLPYLAVMKDGWGRGRQAWRATYDEAHRHCYDMLNNDLGLTGNLREGPY